MTETAVREALLAHARALGADLAGIALVADLRAAADARLGAAHADAAKLDAAQVGAAQVAPGVVWPDGARSVLVVAVAHPPDRPELDWWFGRSDPPGNKLLSRIVQGLCDWAGRGFGLRAVHLPYHVERGGIYLKDAAAVAGLGRIGLNNLLVTPEHGPRVRLRALTLDAELPPTGSAVFDSCAACDAPCRAACPQGAFYRGTTGQRAVRGAAAPASPSDFSRPACEIQMDLDVGQEEAGVIRYCRACELACPVGAP